MIFAHYNDKDGLRILRHPSPTYSYPCLSIYNKLEKSNSKIYFETNDEAIEALYEWVSKCLASYDMDTLVYTKKSLAELLLYSELFSRWVGIEEYANLINNNTFATIVYERIKI